jgi:hypothetical protein
MSSGRLAFPKTLTWEMLYHDLSRKTRSELHRRSALVTAGATALAHRIAAADGSIDDELAAELAVTARQRLAAADMSATAHGL